MNEGLWREAAGYRGTAQKSQASTADTLTIEAHAPCSAGAALLAELRRQQAAQAAAGAGAGSRPSLGLAGGLRRAPSGGPLQRDLLGRRLPASAAESPRCAPAAAASGAASPGSSSASFLLPAAAPAAVPLAPLATQLEQQRVQSTHPDAGAGQPGKTAWHVFAKAGGGSRAWGEGVDTAAVQREDSLMGAVPPPPLAELRKGLLAGLQRTCHTRRMQGMLSAQVRGSVVQHGAPQRSRRRRMPQRARHAHTSACPQCWKPSTSYSSC